MRERGGDANAVVEAGYRLDRGEREWLEGIVEVLAPQLDEGLGVVAWTYELSAGRARTAQTAFGGAMALLPLRRNVEMTEAISAELAVGGAVVTLSASLCAMSQRKLTTRTRSYAEPLGWRDILRASATDPDGFGIGVAVPLGARRQPTRLEQAYLGRILAHLCTALRVRRRRERTGEAIDEAISRTDFRAELAERGARREAVVAIDRAGRWLEGTEAGRVLDAWRAMIDGSWTLFEQFEHDGRRFLVARRKEPWARPCDGLTTQEVACAIYAADGHSQKLIAYELGLSEATVSLHLRRSMRKLGLRSRAELCRAFGGSRR